MRQRWADYGLFWREFRRAFHTTGAVLPSGRGLARALTTYVRQPAGPRRILEVGPGTGAVTREIIAALGDEDRLVLVERNPHFVQRLRQHLADGNLPADVARRVEVVHSSVESLPAGEPFDLIISGLPLNNFSVDVVAGLVAAMRERLAPGGTLSFFEYIAIRRAKSLLTSAAERDRLRGIATLLDRLLADHAVRRERVLANVPPAWVHHVRFEIEKEQQQADASTPV